MRDNVISLRGERAQRAVEAALNDLELIREQLLDIYAGSPEGTPYNAAAACLMVIADRLVAIAQGEVR